MRIAIDTQSTLGRKTGIGHYTAQLLAALRRVAPQHTYLPLDWGHDPRMRIDRRLRWQQWEMPRRARRWQADLLHVPGFDAPVWQAGRVVLTVHDLIGALFPENFPPVSRWYWSRWLPGSLRAAAGLIADSEATRRDIVRLTRIPAERVTVVPLAADARFQPADADAVTALRQKHGLPEEFVLFVGTLEPRKGIDTLLMAFQQLAARGPAHLVIAGQRGWLVERSQQQPELQALQARLHFLDYVPDGDMPALYSAARVLALPSRYEGFGLPVLEAMACGTPVVCSNAASLPEVAGAAAVLVAPDQPDALAEALERVLLQPEWAAELRERGLRRAQSYSWDRTAAQTLAVYERVAR